MIDRPIEKTMIINSKCNSNFLHIIIFFLKKILNTKQLTLSIFRQHIFIYIYLSVKININKVIISYLFCQISKRNDIYYILFFLLTFFLHLNNISIKIILTYKNDYCHLSYVT